MGDERSWGDGRADPSRRRPPSRDPLVTALTVEQLVARQGGTSGRRAARRAGSPEPGASGSTSTDAPPRPLSGLRPGGLPPGHPSAPVPPLPPSAQPSPQQGRPQPSRPVPPLPGTPPSRPPAIRPGGGARPSTPLPPLPGRPPARPGSAGRAGALALRARRATATPGRRRLVRVLVALAAVVGLFLMYELGLYFYVDRSIGRVDALATDGPEVLAPQLQVGTDTYLVVGTHLPGGAGATSVTVLLASVSADGSRAVLLDVPPAGLLDTPECRTSAGALREPRTETFAAALLDGGPSCAVRAVQELSGLRVDHYLDVDLSRLPAMVDALGSVPVCAQPSAALSAASRPLPLGSSHVSGAQAAAYLRPGPAGADPTGTAAAQRAQLLLTSTLRAAMSGSTLTSPVTLTRFLTRASGALTTDRQTTLGDLRSLGSTLGKLSGGAVQRTDLPVAQAAYVPAGSKQPAVLLDAAATRTLFDSVIGHTRLPAQAAAPAAPAAGEGGESPAPAAPAPAPVGAGVTVDVLNGTGTAGLAASAADQLRAAGFTVGTVGNASAKAAHTAVRYAAAAQDQARTLASAVPGATLQADPAVPGVQLVIGPGWNGVVPPAPAPATEAAPAPTAAAAGPTVAAAAPPVRC